MKKENEHWNLKLDGFRWGLYTGVGISNVGMFYYIWDEEGKNWDLSLVVVLMPRGTSMVERRLRTLAAAEGTLGDKAIVTTYIVN